MTLVIRDNKRPIIAIGTLWDFLTAVPWRECNDSQTLVVDQVRNYIAK